MNITNNELINLVKTSDQNNTKLKTPHPGTISELEENIIKELNNIVKDYILINIYNGGFLLENFLKGLERKVLEDTLSITNGNQKRASQILGLKPTTFYRKLKKYNIRKVTENQLKIKSL